MMMAIDVDEQASRLKDSKKNDVIRRSISNMQDTIMRFYQAPSAVSRQDSSDEDDTLVYMHTGKTMNGKGSSKGYRKLKTQNGDAHAEFGTVKQVQPHPCCSRKACLLLFTWMVLFILGVLGLTLFIQFMMNRAGKEGHDDISFAKYDELKNTTNSGDVVPCDDFIVTKIWHSSFEKLQTETAVRFVDVNSDEVDDAVIAFGTGVDGYNVQKVVCDLYFKGMYPCFGGAMALDGKTGREIWRHYSGHEIYAVNCNGDLNNDGVPDCLLGGRGGVFDAINGKNGGLLWAFADVKVRSDIMNLYTAQFIHDLNNDSVMDVLQVHGGDPLAEAYSEKRLVGRIIIFSGKSGKILRWVETPDGKESYFSPLLYTLKNGTEMVIFGTGGETHGGALYVIQLMDLYYGKVHKAVALYKDKHKGVMNPPVLIDLNKDGTVDMVNAMFNSTVVAFDGETFKVIWRYDLPNTESYSIPSPGYFNNDDTIDFMARFNFGKGFPTYYHSNITVLDGLTGKPIISQPLRSSGAANPSPLSISMEGKGNDLFLYWIADCLGHEGEGGVFTFVEGTNVHEQSRADTCMLRYKTRGFSNFSVMNRRTQFPGKTIYNSVVYHDLEHIDLGRNIQRQDIKRKARHIGVPDHGGIQRLIATGGITKSLNAKTDRFGYSDSIDVVFPVYWMYPAKTRVLTEKDIKCVKAYRELAKKGKVKLDIDPSRNHANGFYDEGDTAVNFCLKNHTEEKGNIYQSQSNYDPHKLQFGRMTVYRFNIKCICKTKSANQKCARMLPMSQQGWGGYMGTLANGLYNGRRSKW